MAAFGVTTEDKPKRIDDLLDSGLMAKLDRMDILYPKNIRGETPGGKTEQETGYQRGVRRLPPLHAWRRPPLHRLEHLRPPRQTLPQIVSRRRRPLAYHRPRPQFVHGLGQSGKVQLLPPPRHGPGVYRSGQPQPRFSLWIQQRRGSSPHQSAGAKANKGNWFMAA